MFELHDPEQPGRLQYATIIEIIAGLSRQQISGLFFLTCMLAGK